MALEMKQDCERCRRPTPENSEAYICSYECTFCTGCATAMNHVCPNCRGMLVLRPTRAAVETDHE